MWNTLESPAIDYIAQWARSERMGNHQPVRPVLFGRVAAVEVGVENSRLCKRRKFPDYVTLWTTRMNRGHLCLVLLFSNSINTIGVSHVRWVVELFQTSSVSRNGEIIHGRNVSQIKSSATLLELEVNYTRFPWKWAASTMLTNIHFQPFPLERHLSIPSEFNWLP